MPHCADNVSSPLRFRDEYAQFTSAGAAVFGISSDSPEENDAFAKAQRLPFPLLTDPSSILRKVFGIPAAMMVRTSHMGVCIHP